MNKYQRRGAREIKALMRRDKIGRLSYKDARKIWQFGRRFIVVCPCEDCDTPHCRKVGTPIVYCPERR